MKKAFNVLLAFALVLALLPVQMSAARPGRRQMKAAANRVTGN